MRLEIDIAKTMEMLKSILSILTITSSILLDLEIDGEAMNGAFKLLNRFGRGDPFTSIVFVSTHSEALPLAFRYHLSALDFISKDQPEEDYRHQLERCLDYVLAVARGKICVSSPIVLREDGALLCPTMRF